MNKKLDYILKEFKDKLAQLYGGKEYGLVCYGSQARGEAHPGSDIDLALIMEGEIQPSKEIDRLADLLVEFNLRYGVLISLLPVDKGTWEKGEGPFWRNVRREGIEI